MTPPNVIPTLSPKGRQELRQLLGANWVADWDGAERAIRAALTLLDQTRPDLLRLYFAPTFWDALQQQPRATRLNALACALRVGVIDLAGWPAVTNASQARFYQRSLDERALAAVRHSASTRRLRHSPPPDTMTRPQSEPTRQLGFSNPTPHSERPATTFNANEQ